MSSFTTDLKLQPLDDGKTFRLLEPFRYRLGSLDSQNIITIPEGFETDFASVPQIFWNILPPWGKYGKAAVLHDYLYKSGMFDRSRCDEIFLEAMEALNVSWIKRKTIYAGVRMGGWIAWNNHRKNDK